MINLKRKTQDFRKKKRIQKKSIIDRFTNEFYYKINSQNENFDIYFNNQIHHKNM